MKLVLGCDNYIYRCDGAFYAKASDKAFYDRYLRVFDTLRIVARTRTASAEEVARYVRLDDARTEVWPVYFFRGPKQYLPKALRVRRDMRGAADGCGACIVRLPSITGSNLLAEVRRKGIPYAVEIVDDAHDEMTGTRNPLYKAIWLLIHHDLLRACRHAAGIACVTESYLQQRYGNPDPACFKSHYSSIALDHAFYAAPRERRHGEEFAICHVAHPIAGRRKGQEELIRAARIVADRGYAVRLRFAGEGPMVPVFEELARELGVSDRVEFVGFLDRPGTAPPAGRVGCHGLSDPCRGAAPRGDRGDGDRAAYNLDPRIGDSRVAGARHDAHPRRYAGARRRIVALIDDDELYRRASAHNFRNSLKYESTLLQARRDEFYRRLRSRAEK